MGVQGGVAVDPDHAGGAAARRQAQLAAVDQGRTSVRQIAAQGQRTGTELGHAARAVRGQVTGLQRVIKRVRRCGGTAAGKGKAQHITRLIVLPRTGQDDIGNHPVGNGGNGRGTGTGTAGDGNRRRADIAAAATTCNGEQAAGGIDARARRRCQRSGDGGGVGLRIDHQTAIVNRDGGGGVEQRDVVGAGLNRAAVQIHRPRAAARRGNRPAHRERAAVEIQHTGGPADLADLRARAGAGGERGVTTRLRAEVQRADTPIEAANDNEIAIGGVGGPASKGGHTEVDTADDAAVAPDNEIPRAVQRAAALDIRSHPAFADPHAGRAGDVERPASQVVSAIGVIRAPAKGHIVGVGSGQIQCAGGLVDRPRPRVRSPAGAANIRRVGGKADGSGAVHIEDAYARGSTDHEVGVVAAAIPAAPDITHHAVTDDGRPGIIVGVAKSHAARTRHGQAAGAGNRAGSADTVIVGVVTEENAARADRRVEHHRRRPGGTVIKLYIVAVPIGNRGAGLGPVGCQIDVPSAAGGPRPKIITPDYRLGENRRSKGGIAAIAAICRRDGVISHRREGGRDRCGPRPVQRHGAEDVRAVLKSHRAGRRAAVAGHRPGEGHRLTGDGRIGRS